jgi:hypothetical protein
MRRLISFILGMITGAALLYFYLKVNGDDVNDIAIAISGAPSIESVERQVKSGVENLLTEDNTKDSYYQLDRFFLSEQTDPLTYIGSLKATYYWKSWSGVIQNEKLYKDVVIKFRDKQYESYTISIKPRE